ncbi:MAG: hypothetical protein HYR88_01485 [Verrucomicrobia bacterium]|nr:hypothetical protein [Verrucomicrobiota bacterium]
MVKRGFLVDAVRGKVRFGEFTNARIPWPKAKRHGKGGSGGFVLCGGLVRALEKEAASAVSHHWGVSRATVSNWRRALELKGRSAGAQRLVKMGAEFARLPESREKIARAARGRVLSPRQRSRLMRGIQQGWKERFEARRAAYRRTGRFPRATKSDPWVPEEEKLLASLSPAEAVRLLGRTSKSIQARRLFLDIRIRPPAERKRWEDWEIKLLGIVSDSAVAKRLGRSMDSIRRKRHKAGIKSPSLHPWTAEEEAIVRRGPDAEAARRLGRSKKAVQHRRRALGLAFYRGEKRKWIASEEALLGTQPDAVLAKMLGRTKASVLMKRLKKGIPPQYTNYRRWTPQEIGLLGTLTDVLVARRLNRSLFSVRTKRLDSKIPPAKNRRWTRNEEKLLGKMPDEEAARKLSRPVGAVRMRRAFLHVPVFQSKLHPWKEWELKLLGRAPDHRVAQRIGRSILAVASKRWELRIPCADPKRIPAVVFAKRIRPAGLAVSVRRREAGARSP